MTHTLFILVQIRSVTRSAMPFWMPTSSKIPMPRWPVVSDPSLPAKWLSGPGETRIVGLSHGVVNVHVLCAAAWSSWSGLHMLRQGRKHFRSWNKSVIIFSRNLALTILVLVKGRELDHCKASWHWMFLRSGEVFQSSEISAPEEMETMEQQSCWEGHEPHFCY